MPLSQGKVLANRYRIASLLGQGGMGAVYRAWDLRLSVPAALKEQIPQPDLDVTTLAQLRQQFRQEAMTLARLSHPNLVRVTDFFEESGNAYLVMDLLQGENLSERISREGQIPEAQVLTWARQLLSALAYCHAQGILHRDIKPQNIILQPDGRVVLVDFGLVKLWNPRDPRTQTVLRGMGTVEYAPPEQYGRVGQTTDPRSDLFSLGATLYHALTGQAPPAISERVADPQVFKPVRALSPQVSATTEAAVLRALEPMRDQRWGTAAEMAAALSGAAAVTKAGSGAAVSKTTAAKPKAASAAHKSGSGPAKRRRIPGWAWALMAIVGLEGLVLALGIAGLAWSFLSPAATAPAAAPGITPTPVLATARPTSTPTPPVRATSTPGHTPTRQAPPTSTPRRAGTSTPAFTATPDATPRAVATATPKPATATRPTLRAPAEGVTIQSPFVFRWDGRLASGQSYIVRARNTRTGYAVQSAALQNASWSVAVPGETYGEWKWTVSVVQGRSTLATSAESGFWFNPFPDSGPSTPEPTSRIPPVYP